MGKNESGIPYPVALPQSSGNQSACRSRKLRVGMHLTLLSAGFLAFFFAAVCFYLPHHKEFVSEPLTLLFGHPLTDARKEELFLSVPNQKIALHTSRKYATHPHLAGSIEDFEDAKVILELFQSQLGIDNHGQLPLYSAGSDDSRHATLTLSSANQSTAWIDVYYPVMNTPLDRAVEILDEHGTLVASLDLVEDGDALDPEAAKYRDAVPAFHGFSHNGEAQGQLVFANYGTQEDYETLDAKGIDLTGKIVIARYGKIFRGLKVKGAQERGAVGVLIYSDPRDDGVVTVENGYAPYPAGPARNPTSVQRGSTQYISIYPGDPTTPGYPAYENATRIKAYNIPHIPSLPISWANAERLLETITEISGARQLNGRASLSTVRLVNHVDDRVIPVWNTMAAVPGHIKDEVVIIGCHRDAWLMGAADPTSGTVALHEVVRAFGALLKRGWKPLRTVVFASWDGEEYGLVGSTEWGEDFSDWISEHVVAYLNVDVASSGSTWVVAASPSLADLIHQTALDVPHPTIPGKTLWDARQDSGPFTELLNAKSRNKQTELIQAVGSRIPPLGSGSDYTVMLQRLGVASVDQGFKAGPFDAPYHYHSVYDSQRWQELYADPGFHRHVAVAKHLGLLGLRIADSIVLPINTTAYAYELDFYVDKIEQIASASSFSLDLTTLRASISELQAASRELDDEKTRAERKFRYLLEKLPHWGSCRRRRFRRIRKWIKGVFGQETTTDQPGVGERDLDSIVEALLDGLSGSESGERSTHRLPEWVLRRLHRAAKRVRAANRKLMAFERGWISEGGIRDREWYKHLLVAPGKWLGYGATTLPALTEALTIDKNVTAAAHEVDRLVYLAHKLSKTLRASEGFSPSHGDAEN